MTKPFTRLKWVRVPDFWILFLLVSFPAAAPAQDLSAPALFREGKALREQGRLHEAASKIQQAVNRDPVRSDYYFELANTYAAIHDSTHSGKTGSTEWLDKSRQALEQGVMMAPQDVAAHYNLGVVYKRLGQYEKARDQFQTVLELDPRQVNAKMQIGATYEDQGFFEEARSTYLEASEMGYASPDFQSVLEDLDRHKDADHEKQMEQMASERMGRFRRGFEYAQFGQAASYESGRLAESDSRSGAAQAVPYLASYIMQEFMNWRARKE